MACLTKRCNACNRTLPVSEFHACATGLHGVRGTCKDCRKVKAARYYLRHRERILRQHMAWYERNRERILNSR